MTECFLALLLAAVDECLDFGAAVAADEARWEVEYHFCDEFLGYPSWNWRGAYGSKP